MKVVIIGGAIWLVTAFLAWVFWLVTAFLAWVFCKAAGDADDFLGTRDGEE